MALKLLEQLGLEDTRDVLDPFGLGVTYHIHHINHPEYQAHIEEVGESPMLEKLSAVARKATFMAGAKARGDDKKAERIFEEEIGALIAAIPDEDLKFTEQDIDGIALLIAGWDGDNEPYSPELAIEALSCDLPLIRDIKEGVDEDGKAEFSILAGSPAGSALGMWVLYQAKQHEEFRAKAVEAVEGNS